MMRNVPKTPALKTGNAKWVTATLVAVVITVGLPRPVVAQENVDGFNRFTAERVFDIEYGNTPRISPDGRTVVYVRHSMDRQTDQDRGDLWTIDVRTGDHRPLVTGGASAGAASWSPDGSKLLYQTSRNGKPELRVLFFDTGETFSLSQFEESPGNAVWSPGGKTIAFSMFVPGEAPSFATRRLPLPWAAALCQHSSKDGRWS